MGLWHIWFRYSGNALLVVTPELRRLIHARATAEALVQQAMAQGMTTLMQDGILKVLAGWTDYAQVTAGAMW